ncbi:MAG: hypothetical protein HKN14_07045 [Marinicaulis sp.]|nr:hypothetical protein [Marinicaulis sp.]NNL90457.1 hypothetical protein [Marinicaulis sp.]
MIDFDDAARHISAVLRMAFRTEDESWRRDIDNSISGVFQSFWAAAFVAPFLMLAYYVAERAARTAPNFDDSFFTKAPSGLLLISEFVAYAVIWAISLWALAMIAKKLGAQKNYSTIVVLFNWAQPLGLFLFVIPAAAFLLSNSFELFAILQLPIIAFNVFIFWNILRRTLPLDVGSAVAIIALIYLIELGVHTTVQSLAVGAYQIVAAPSG